VTKLTFQAGKRYVTRQGRVAVIDQIAPDGNWCLVGRCKGKSAIWNKAGRYDRHGYDHEMDLVEELREEGRTN
jgi:hypothetical protein